MQNKKPSVKLGLIVDINYYSNNVSDDPSTSDSLII